jgi:hypothetical protein
MLTTILSEMEEDLQDQLLSTLQSFITTINTPSFWDSLINFQFLVIIVVIVMGT